MEQTIDPVLLSLLTPDILDVEEPVERAKDIPDKNSKES